MFDLVYSPVSNNSINSGKVNATAKNGFRPVFFLLFSLFTYLSSAVSQASTPNLALHDQHNSKPNTEQVLSLDNFTSNNYADELTAFIAGDSSPPSSYISPNTLNKPVGITKHPTSYQSLIRSNTATINQISKATTIRITSINTQFLSFNQPTFTFLPFNKHITPTDDSEAFDTTTL